MINSFSGIVSFLIALLQLVSHLHFITSFLIRVETIKILSHSRHLSLNPIWWLIFEFRLIRKELNSQQKLSLILVQSGTNLVLRPVLRLLSGQGSEKLVFRITLVILICDRESSRVFPLPISINKSNSFQSTDNITDISSNSSNLHIKVKNKTFMPKIFRRLSKKKKKQGVLL